VKTRGAATLTFALLAFAASAGAQVANLNFEEGAAGEAPPGWKTSTSGFAARTVDGGASGAKAALLAPIAAATNAAQFGNLMQSVDATPYRGRWIRVRASLKVGRGTAPRAQLWVRVDRPGGKMGFFDNMMNRSVRAKEWTTVEINADVAEDATTLNFGLLLLGDGEALVDDVSIVAGEKVSTRTEPARAVDARGLANLTAFARLFGYIRHFHPSDQAAAAQWDVVAVDGVRAIESAATPSELATKLRAIFEPLAPTVQIYVTGQPPTADLIPPVAQRKDVQVVYWRHTGFGQKESQLYHSDRVRKDAPHGNVPPGIHDPRHPFEVDLGGGVSARIPLAVLAGASGTLPKRDPLPASALVKFSGDDRATRIADVVLLWNVLQHFYPYFDVVKTDWLAVLPKALSTAATDSDEGAFLRTLRTMMAELQDGHGQVFQPSEPRSWSLPLLFGWVEDELVVTRVADESLDIRPGDLVMRIDGKDAKQLFADVQRLEPGATPQFKRWGALQRLRSGGKDSEVTLQLKRGGGETRTVVVRRTKQMDAVDEIRPPKIGELEPGIFYIDLSRVTNADFDHVLPLLTAARGVIFDLRGYPHGSIGFLSHLIDVPIQSARWNVPIITRPDHTIDDYDTSGRWDIGPQAPRIHGKVVFLTDGRAISYAESIMGIIEAYKIAEIVGEPTAGTNGNINPVTLPGGYNVVFTGMRVLKHDGSQHHGVGIQPTVRVSPTLRGITEGRDEQLEMAIRIVKGTPVAGLLSFRVHASVAEHIDRGAAERPRSRRRLSLSARTDHRSVLDPLRNVRRAECREIECDPRLPRTLRQRARGGQVHRLRG
jgi:C-terminal processing protease CtpA/Prc